MDAGSTLSMFALAGMVVGLSIAGTEMFKRWLSYKEQKLAAMRTASLDNADRRSLEQRLAVLERIVTDKGYDVAQQIEALRTPATSLAAHGERENA